MLLTISLGITEGYSAVLLPQLESDPEWDIDTELSSWIASIATLPMFAGCLVSGWAMETIGRKSLHIATCIPNLIGWLLIAFCGRSVVLLLLGRFVTGICVGIISGAIMVYVAETSDPVFRGFLLPGASLAMSTGIAIAHVLGTYLEWKLVALLSCIFPTASFVLMLFVPESPIYLIKRGRVALAANAFFWFRGTSEESKSEFEVLVSKQEIESQLPKKSFLEYIQVFTRPEFYKPLGILALFFATMQLAGNNPMAFYTVNIFQDVLGNSSIDAYTSMFITDAVRIVGAVSACFCQQYMRRKTLMIFSCSGTWISLFVLSGYLYAVNDLSNYLSWLPVAGLTGYALFINLGLIPLPYAMSGELFAQNSRGLGSSVVTLFNMLCFFVVVKVTPSLFEQMGSRGVFLLFGTCCLVGMSILWLVLPETKDRPLHEIEDYFVRGKSSVNNTSN